MITSLKYKKTVSYLMWSVPDEHKEDEYFPISLLSVRWPEPVPGYDAFYIPSCFGIVRDLNLLSIKPTSADSSNFQMNGRSKILNWNRRHRHDTHAAPPPEGSLAGHVKSRSLLFLSLVSRLAQTMN